MAKNAYTYAKRAKELAKKKKQEEKRERKTQKSMSEESADPTMPDADAPAGAEVDTARDT